MVVAVRKEAVERLFVSQFGADEAHQSVHRNGPHPRKMTGRLGQVFSDFAGLHGP